MNWSDEQLQAINEYGKNIIVSAGAGSGKTAVLTERVKQKLLKGTHINELLVLTFTNAASQEMKERIRREILKTPSLIEEKSLIDGAYITTFDSFSLSIVKKYHTRLNVSNNISICDEVLIDIAKKKILDEIFDENYLLVKQDFLKLINNFCLKDDKELKNYILNAYKKIELKYDKTKFLENAISYEFSEERINYYIDKYVDLLRIKQKDIEKLLNDASLYFDGDFSSKLYDNFKSLLEANSYNEFIKSLDYQTLRVPKNTEEEAKRIKQTIFDLAKEIKELCTYEDENSLREELLSTKSNIEVIVNILKEFDKRLDKYKEINEYYNFTDIARLAIKVVDENEDIKEELKNSFKEILVDEYQDTSDTQELFISLISNNNAYMVGDIKQSIYRFRNANPSIFKYKYNSYQNPSNNDLKIDLLKNFRSRSEVLNNINLLFDLFMDEEIGGAEYKVSHRMVFGNTTYDKEKDENQNYNMEVLVYDKDELDKLTKDEEEAFIIGQDIKNKIEQRKKVFDKETKSLREIKYQDCVILLDKSKNFDLYKKVFEYLQIPLNVLKDESLKKDEDSLIIRNLFRFLICVKENRFDKEFEYTYTSISRSFLFKTDDNEIYKHIINKDYKDTELYKKSLELIKDMDTMNLSSYYEYVLKEFNYDEKLLTIGNIKSYKTREEYFYNLCKNYESLGNTIYDFTDYLNQIFDGNYDLKFNVNTNSTNSCKIMTIHKSKGLEFPICYFAGFSSKFSDTEIKDKIIFDNEYGFILPKIDDYYKDTFLKTLYKNQYKKDDISERIRLLYVALTRAKEKMIFVIPKQEEDIETNDFVPNYIREKYHSFLTIMKSIYSVLLPYTKEVEIVGSKAYLNRKEKEKINTTSNELLNVEELNIKEEIIEEKHFSKESLKLISKEEKEKMEYGIKVHEILEEIDFINPNFNNYNVEDSIISKVKSFLNSNLLKDLSNTNIYKEYEFIYEEDNELNHGIIDLLLEKEDKMIIIDYKLKNIDDSLYDKQLNGYRKYIYNKTKKNVECYLYSIIDETYKEVTNN